MEIVSEQTHRVLAYIDAVNRHGAKPSHFLVDEFADEPDQKFRSFGIQATMRSALSTYAFMDRSEPSETFSTYLSRIGLATNTYEVELTKLGRALLKALNTPTVDENASDVIEIVLDPENPFAYAQALNAMSNTRQAMLVEPYFRLEQLMDIAEFDNITQVLVGPRLKLKDYELLATGLASLGSERHLEIKKAAELHDRYLIPAEPGEAVLMLGASLGGIGKRVSTLTTLGPVASQALRDAHESIWKDSEVINPKKIAAIVGPAPDTAGADQKAAPSKKATKKPVAKKKAATN